MRTVEEAGERHEGCKAVGAASDKTHPAGSLLPPCRDGGADAEQCRQIKIFTLITSEAGIFLILMCMRCMWKFSRCNCGEMASEFCKPVPLDQEESEEDSEIDEQQKEFDRLEEEWLRGEDEKQRSKQGGRQREEETTGQSDVKQDSSDEVSSIDLPPMGESEGNRSKEYDRMRTGLRPPYFNMSRHAVRSSSEGEEEDDELSEGEILEEGAKWHKRRRITMEEYNGPPNEGERRRYQTKKQARMLPTYQKPPMAFPVYLTETQKREAVYFQRKMRAFRNLKNYLLTAKQSCLQEEARRKGWGPLPDFILHNRPRHTVTHVEVMYHHWPRPFDDVEKMWLGRHLKEFSKQWAIPDEEVLSSRDLTPYMRFIRCYPPEALLELRDVRPPENRPTKYQLGLPITGENPITDAKAILTYYGMHRLKEWEVHDNIDFGMMDYQVLLEEFQEVSKVMLARMKRYKREAKVAYRKYKTEKRIADYLVRR